MLGTFSYFVGKDLGLPYRSLKIVRLQHVNAKITANFLYHGTTHALGYRQWIAIRPINTT